VRSKVDGRTLALTPSVKFIQQMGTGYDNLDLVAIEAAGIAAANNPGFNASTVAEHTLMLMLVLLRRFAAAYEATRNGAFPAAAFIGANQPHMRELGDETVGLIGFGSIGRAVAERLAGLKPQVLYYARHRVDGETEARLGARYAPLDELLAKSGIVSLHLPSNIETLHMIGTAELAQMQPGALLINTSRGELIDESALRAAIVEGHIGGAGLDVVDAELTEVQPFGDLPQVIVTPHSAGISRSSLPRMLRRTVENIDRYVKGEPVHNLLTSRQPG
jgi:lactate dehydrogenase-like 2-hydroxyacid dehydrogenase